MNFLKLLLLALLVLSALDGCSSKGNTRGDEDEYGPMEESTAGPGSAGGPRIGRYGTGGSGAYDGSGAGRHGAGGDREDPDDPSSTLAQKVIYFEYDSFEVQPQFRSIVSAHAHYLASHPDRSVVLEGHADERGSPEYNIALGEQRAQAVQRMLELQGAGSGQIRVVSFGEEKPADPGHDESSWQLNRRVEIFYSGH